MIKWLTGSRLKPTKNRLKSLEISYFLESWGLQPSLYLGPICQMAGIEEQRVNVIIRFDRSETRKLKKLGHGYQIDAEIILWQRQNVIRVPIAALFRDEGGHWQVFAIQNGRAAQRTVRLGHINEDYGEVLSGLEADLPVILNPTRTLQNNVRVKARSSVVN